ncbi:hypothetical protein [Candidatus Chromulinivorax destructor]|uniref:CopG family transcriptional regulator n=1 Tax=Candidatus Chromulinivorax destructor TaxID=2066483 RepID=A0A345ZCY8_9BACT|nr:hypothetical protein [Candidatus Chromulinivorax destructor]AXK61155.1 hypothetical protein C0J27_05495 [Candidatus Chromulinivorax destructor]
MEIQKITTKLKTTIYISDEDEQLLDELFIKRMRDKNKTDRSALLCEGIRLLYAKEIGSSENHK